jgi:hypothetical protein
MHLALGYSETLLFIRTPRLLCGNSYLWHVRVVMYERPTTDRIHRIHLVVEASTPRWMFQGGMMNIFGTMGTTYHGLERKEYGGQP